MSTTCRRCDVVHETVDVEVTLVEHRARVAGRPREYDASWSWELSIDGVPDCDSGGQTWGDKADARADAMEALRIIRSRDCPNAPYTVQYRTEVRR